MPTALVRPPGPALLEALTGHFVQGVRPDPDQAAREHALVVDGLRWLGFDVEILPDEGHPDGCFVEDHAVIADGRALLCRTGAPSRRPEASRIHAWLRERLPTVAMQEGCLDGGDVLVAGCTILVGQGTRSDAGGLDAVRRAFPDHEVVAVPVPKGSLHLKCVASAPAGRVISAIDLPVAHTRVPLAESYGANAVGRGDRVLVAAGHPAVEAALEGLQIRRIDLQALKVADGSLTCLSLLLP